MSSLHHATLLRRRVRCLRRHLLRDSRLTTAPADVSTLSFASSRHRPSLSLGVLLRKTRLSLESKLRSPRGLCGKVNNRKLAVDETGMGVWGVTSLSI
jgi:hypothetical protein